MRPRHEFKHIDQCAAMVNVYVSRPWMTSCFDISLSSWLACCGLSWILSYFLLSATARRVRASRTRPPILVADGLSLVIRTCSSLTQQGRQVLTFQLRAMRNWPQTIGYKTSEKTMTSRAMSLASSLLLKHQNQILIPPKTRFSSDPATTPERTPRPARERGA